jgi:hypothetical protein
MALSSATLLLTVLAMVTVLHARSGHDAGNAERGVAAEHNRIEECIVDAAVHHVDALQPARGAHVDNVFVDDQVASLDELDAHLSSQERVLEVRRVEDTGREHDDGRAVTSGRWRDVAQRAQQGTAVVVDGAHVLRAEEHRQHLGHRRAVLEHVADAARVAHVVLEHAIGAVAVAHEVDAGDEAARTVGDRHVDGFALEAV